jgi:hypothetical protein
MRALFVTLTMICTGYVLISLTNQHAIFGDTRGHKPSAAQVVQDIERAVMGKLMV